MTREEAVQKIHGSGVVRGAGDLVDALTALGLLKLDAPPSAHDEGVQFIANMVAVWEQDRLDHRPLRETVAQALARNGYTIVRKPVGMPSIASAQSAL